MPCQTKSAPHEDTQTGKRFQLQTYCIIRSLKDDSCSIQEGKNKIEPLRTGFFFRKERKDPPINRGNFRRENLRLTSGHQYN